jgi:hypothetical protein
MDTVTVGKPPDNQETPLYVWIALAACAVILLIAWTYVSAAESDVPTVKSDSFDVEAAVEALRRKQEQLWRGEAPHHLLRK